MPFPASIPPVPHSPTVLQAPSQNRVLTTLLTELTKLSNGSYSHQQRSPLFICCSRSAQTMNSTDGQSLHIAPLTYISNVFLFHLIYNTQKSHYNISHLRAKSTNSSYNKRCYENPPVLWGFALLQHLTFVHCPNSSFQLLVTSLCDLARSVMRPS